MEGFSKTKNLERKEANQPQISTPKKTAEFTLTEGQESKEGHIIEEEHISVDIMDESAVAEEEQW